MAEFISIISSEKGGDSPHTTKKVFDYEINLYDKTQEDYSKVYDFCSNDINKKKVFISKDKYIGLPLISGLNEVNNSNVKILYFSNYHDMENYNSDKVINSLMSQLTGYSECNFKEHKLNVKPEQVIFFGLNDEDYDLDTNQLENLGLEYYTLSLIKKKGFENIISRIIDSTDCKILAYFNLEVFNKKICPSVNRRNLSIEEDINLDNSENKLSKHTNGLEYLELETISNILRNKVDYLIITGFDSSIDNETNFPSRLSSEVVQILYRNIMNLKEKKINVFNENSRFLMFREVKQKSEEDIGWYLLRMLSMEDRQNILKHIEDDKIYTINLDDYGIDEYNNSDKEDIMDNDILITATTIEDQKIKSYYHSKSIMDCALFPQEKFLMGFELVNF
jgi:hypothetical protein